MINNRAFDLLFLIVERNTNDGEKNTTVESGCIYADVPAKKVKTLSAEHFNEPNERIANNYVMYGEWFK